MPMQALAATLSILLFRAGPQDFPYTEDAGLSRACIAIALIASALFFSLTTPLFPALLAAGVAVGGVAIFVRALLHLRKLDNRRTQTLNALLAVGSVLLLLMRLPLSTLAPEMSALVDSIKTAEEAAGNAAATTPDLVTPQFPLLPSLLVDLLSIWFVAVSAHIFRQAANLGFFGGALAALLCQFNVMMLLVFTAPLISLFGA